MEHLLDQPGAAYDPVLFEFVNDINEDQEAEIEQMNKMLVTAGLPEDVGKAHPDTRAVRPAHLLLQGLCRRT